MMETQDFHNKHKGETCMIVGLGPNQTETPLELFDYPSFSVNSIYKHETWEPTYYVGVDRRLWVENEKEIMTTFAHIPKFIPSPDYDTIHGDNLYRFYNRRGEIYIGGQMPNNPDALTKRGIAYRRVMGAVFQIAYFMGFTRILVLGVSHKPDDAKSHFWGQDEGCNPNQPLVHWFDEYRHWAHVGLAEVINLSPNTYVPEDVMDRGNWKAWVNNED